MVNVSVFYMLDLTLLQLKVLWEIKKKPKCGYELMCLSKKRITQGTIYPLLQSMEKMQLVQQRAKKGRCGKKPCRCKKYYEITKLGEKALEVSCKNLCKIYKEIFKTYVCRRCKK